MAKKEFRLIFYGKTEKQLNKINRKELKIIMKKIEALKTDSRPASALKLISEADYYRLRVGDYRVVYKINDKGKEIYVIAVKHRSEVYRKLK